MKTVMTLATLIILAVPMTGAALSDANCGRMYTHGIVEHSGDIYYFQTESVADSGSCRVTVSYEANISDVVAQIATCDDLWFRCLSDDDSGDFMDYWTLAYNMSNEYSAFPVEMPVESTNAQLAEQFETLEDKMEEGDMFIAASGYEVFTEGIDAYNRLEIAFPNSNAECEDWDHTTTCYQKGHISGSSHSTSYERAWSGSFRLQNCYPVGFFPNWRWVCNGYLPTWYPYESGFSTDGYVDLSFDF